MPYNDPDPDDPMSLNGVAFETTPALALDAAYTFAEEFARIGKGREEIVAMFQAPHFQGPYSAFQLLGLPAIQEIVHQCCTVMEECRTARHNQDRQSTSS